MKYLSALLITSLLFLAVKCPKPDNKPPQTPPEVLPPATQTGANTFGCLLNGKVWLPQGGTYPSLNVQYYKGEFLLAAKKDSGKETSQGIYQIFQTITWSYKSIYGPGTYHFRSAPGGGSPGAGFWDYYDSCFYNSDNRDSLNTYVTITKLDSAKRIISGTFNLIYIPSINAVNANCDTVKITNGRFDTVYTY